MTELTTMMLKLTTLLQTTISAEGFVAIGVLSIFLPIVPLLYAMLFLIFADNITGIMAYYTSNKYPFSIFRPKTWKHIKSTLLGNSLIKTLAYFLLIVSAFVIDTYLLCNVTGWFTKIIVGAIAFREMISIVENVEVATGGGLIRIIKIFITKGITRGAIDAIDNKEKKK